MIKDSAKDKRYFISPLRSVTEEKGRIYATLLVRLCDLVAPLVLILRTSMVNDFFRYI